MKTRSKISPSPGAPAHVFPLPAGVNGPAPARIIGRADGPPATGRQGAGIRPRGIIPAVPLTPPSLRARLRALLAERVRAALAPAADAAARLDALRTEAAELRRRTTALATRVDRLHADLAARRDRVRRLAADWEARRPVGFDDIGPELTLDATLRLHPGARAVLAARHLPDCTGCAVRFDETLAEAAEAYELDLEALLRDLRALFAP